MIIRPTSIIAHSTVDGDLREFTHSLNQQLITDTDCVIPITHKGQLTQIHRKDLSAGMSPWSAYHRRFLTSLELDLDYLCQGITWYREFDDNEGVMKSYWYQGDRSSIEVQSQLLQDLGSQMSIELHGRFLQIITDGLISSYTPSQNIHQALSRYLGLLINYATIQSSGEVITSLKIDIPLTAQTRSQLQYIQQDCVLLAEYGLFIGLYQAGSGMREYVQLVCSDPEIHQMILPYLQMIDSGVVMTTLDTLQTRSEQITGLLDSGYIAKPRQLT